MYTVFGITHCPSCDKAKRLLDQKGKDYAFVNLDYEPEKFEKLANLGLRSVPQIFDEDGNHLGGFEELYLSLK